MIATPPADVRPARPSDLDAVLRLERSAFARPWSAASLADELARDDRSWLVAEVADAGGEAADAVVAVAGVADLAGDAHVLSVAVDPGHRRRGYGTVLVRALLAGAVERFGVARATLEVRASNLAARELYRRLGFTEAGVRPGYYQDDGEDAVVLWCDLPLADPNDRPPSPPLAVPAPATRPPRSTTS